MRPLVNEVATAIRDQDVQAFQAARSRLARAARDTASPAELTAVIQELVPLLRTANGISTELAVLAGACVEWGGSPVPLAEVLPGRAVTALFGYELFPDIWRAASGGRPLPDGNDNVAVTSLVADYAARNGLRADLYRTVATSWFDVMDWIKPMITCMARREFRAALPAEAVTAVRDAAAAIAVREPDEHSDGTALSAHWLEGLAMVLDDEPLVVLDPASGRGFRLTMSGIGDNFQLHTLLADRLSGEDGVPGLVAPRRDWVAEATDAPLVNHFGTDPIVRRFRLYDGTGSYVYPEGRPADIGMTGGTRVLVIHPPNGMYGWANARTYAHMNPVLTLDTALAPEEAANWLGRIAPANETDIMSAQ
jgi:hypothetical protein